MKRAMLIGGSLLCTLILPMQKSHAQIPVAEIIKQGVKKVIRAIDLKIQRLQNETIWLQNAQKTLENKMHQLKLDEIADWVEKQRKLYADYYEELWKVKFAITTYRKVKEIISNEAQLVREYKQASARLKRDKQLTSDEIDYIETVYLVIFEESTKNLDEIYLAINSFVTQMSDAKRLELIDRAGNSIERNLSDLRQFTNQNILLSLQRAKDRSEINVIKSLYGIK
jgi:hypothetical protein